MSWLDLGLVVFLAVHALMGLGAGFLRGLLGLLGAAAALALAVAAAPTVAGWLPAWVPWAGAVAGWGTLIVAWLVVPRLAMMLAPVPEEGVSGWNRALGWLPGLAWGVLGAACFLWLYAAFAGGVPAESPIAATLHAWTRPALTAIAPAPVPTAKPSSRPKPRPSASGGPKVSDE